MHLIMKLKVILVLKICSRRILFTVHMDALIIIIFIMFLKITAKILAGYHIPVEHL